QAAPVEVRLLFGRAPGRAVQPVVVAGIVAHDRETIEIVLVPLGDLDFLDIALVCQRILDRALDDVLLVLDLASRHREHQTERQYDSPHHRPLYRLRRVGMSLESPADATPSAAP